MLEATRVSTSSAGSGLAGNAVPNAVSPSLVAAAAKSMAPIRSWPWART